MFYLDESRHSGAESPLPQVLSWLRTDVPGSEIVTFDDAGGLTARGSQHAVDPVPYSLRYRLRTDADGTASHFDARCEGAGWWRVVEVMRSANGWTSAGDGRGSPELASFDGRAIRQPAEPGIVEPESLRAALDLDLGGSPFTNSLPVRRLGLRRQPAGRIIRIVSAWVLPPTLEVIASPQTYGVIDASRIAYGDAGTRVVVEYDHHGWVLDYPGLARRV